MAKLLSGRLKELNVGIKSYSENITTLNVVGISSFSDIILNSSVSAGGTTGVDGQYLQSTGFGVTWSSLSSIRSSNTYTATPGQTTFNLSYSVGLIDLYVNGVRLTDSEYNASNGTSIILNEALFGGESIDIIAYTEFGSVSSPSGLSTSGLLSSTGNGSSLTGIVTYITAGVGISISQNTGNVTISATGGGGGGGGETLDQTLALGNTSSRGMTVGILTANTVYTDTIRRKTDNSTNTKIALDAGSIKIYAGNGVTPKVRVNGGVGINTDLNITGITTASGFIKSGGTSSQFLKADGSVDTSTYATQSFVGLATNGLLNSKGNGSSLSGIVTSITAGSGISINHSTGNVTISGSTVSATDNNILSGITTFNGNIVSTAIFKVQQVEETYNSYSTTINSGATVSLDCSNGNTFYITSTVNGNWTANLTNLNLSSNCLTNVTLVIAQGATSYIPNALQIGGVSQTINWQAGAVPSGNNSKKDVVAFTIFYTGSAYNIFGQLVTFG